MREGQERKIKVNTIQRLINSYLEVCEDFNQETKAEMIRKLISLLVSWYP